MEIYRRIINRGDKKDDCIYQLVFDGGVYRWHYRMFTHNPSSKQYVAPIIYRENPDRYRLDGILEFSPEDLNEDSATNN